MDSTPPLLSNVAIFDQSGAPIQGLSQRPPFGWDCGQAPTIGLVFATATDNRAVTRVWFNWTVTSKVTFSGQVTMESIGDNRYRGQLGPFDMRPETMGGGSITVTVHARDAAGNLARQITFSIGLGACRQAPG